MADSTKPEETKEAKETPRSTAEADFTKYKVSILQCFVRAPPDLIRINTSRDRVCRVPHRLLPTSSMRR